MISWHDLYTVLTAVVPLYAAMILAYGSVRWWRIFSPEQCAGINRFVAVFAVPLLSFHFISTNDPYSMNLRFIAADTLQKLLALAALAAWSRTPSGSLDRAVTAFSLAALPNTLVMGIPLLIAMYGQASGSLMVQIVVLQCILWYTLLLFLFEFRAARALVAHQFPDTATHIVSFHVDPDVVSLADGEGEAEVGADGRVRVTVRRSNVSRRSVAPNFVTPRPSNLTGAEIYSLSSSRNPTPRGSNFNNSDLFAMVGGPPPPPPPQHLRDSSFGAADLYSLQSSCRPSSFDDHADTKKAADAKDLHMFAWSAANSPPPPAGEAGGLHVFGDAEFAGASPPVAERDGANEVRMQVHSDHPAANGSSAQMKGVNEVSFEEGSGGVEGIPPASGGGGRAAGRMPPASVMTRLILLMVWRKLIRNPNTYSSLIGLFWSLVAFRCHVSMPRIVEKSISILSDAGLGMAMFSLGLFMALQPRLIACGNKAAVVAMVVRFLAGPAVMAFASIAVGLRGDLLRVAIVQAALPQGIVPFVFAKEYNVHPAVLSTAVIFGMLIALPITLVYYIVLGL